MILLKKSKIYRQNVNFFEKVNRYEFLLAFETDLA